MWFIFALATVLMWGFADLFYKKGADERDRYSHLKTTVAVGVVMGFHAASVLIFTDVGYDIRNIIIYLPVSLFYITSMAVGYFGLRYLELSISSPVQNTSGALVCILCLVILGQTMDALSAVAVVIICASLIVLGWLERDKRKTTPCDPDHKFRIGAFALFIPIIYCVLDALGTFFDAYYLDDIEATPLVGVNEDNFENVANISYELTFFIAAVAILIFLFIKKEPFLIRDQGPRAAAALFETVGQLTYVYAMSGNAVVAAPMIASYSIVSVALSRIFLKEKLTLWQKFAVGAVLLGIVLLGIAEGIAESE